MKNINTKRGIIDQLIIDNELRKLNCWFILGLRFLRLRFLTYF